MSQFAPGGFYGGNLSSTIDMMSGTEHRNPPPGLKAQLGEFGKRLDKLEDIAGFQIKQSGETDDGGAAAISLLKDRFLLNLDRLKV